MEAKTDGGHYVEMNAIHYRENLTMKKFYRFPTEDATSRNESGIAQ